MFSSIKTTTESSKQDDWLGLKDEPNDDDQFPPRGTQKTQPSVTTLIKKTPIAPIQETRPTVAEPPKKSVIDILLEDDRRTLTEKPNFISNNTTQNLWLDDQTTSNKRLATGGISNTSSYTDNQQIKSPSKTLFGTKTDSGRLKILKIFNFCSFSLQLKKCLKHQKIQFSLMIHSFLLQCEQIHLP